MVQYLLTEDKDPREYHYILKTVEELNELVKQVYTPIFGRYLVSLQLNDKKSLRTIIQEQSRYSHLELFVKIPKSLFNDMSLSLPGSIQLTNKPILEYLKEGIAKRNLVIKNSVMYSIYASIDKEYEEVDEVLNLLLREHGKFLDISKNDLAKYINIVDIVYPREVLISYINMYEGRKWKLDKCLEQIDKEIVLASMIKTIKKLTKQKLEYLKTGVGSKFIHSLNTRNLMLLNYHLRFNKNYNMNDIVLLLYQYEKGGI